MAKTTITEVPKPKTDTGKICPFMSTVTLVPVENSTIAQPGKMNLAPGSLLTPCIKDACERWDTERKRCAIGRGTLKSYQDEFAEMMEIATSKLEQLLSK